jgi:hypothetical protein
MAAKQQSQKHLASSNKEKLIRPTWEEDSRKSATRAWEGGHQTLNGDLLWIEDPWRRGHQQQAAGNKELKQAESAVGNCHESILDPLYEADPWAPASKSKQPLQQQQQGSNRGQVVQPQESLAGTSVSACGRAADVGPEEDKDGWVIWQPLPIAKPDAEASKAAAVEVRGAAEPLADGGVQRRHVGQSPAHLKYLQCKGIKGIAVLRAAAKKGDLAISDVEVAIAHFEASQAALAKTLPPASDAAHAATTVPVPDDDWDLRKWT